MDIYKWEPLEDKTPEKLDIISLFDDTGGPLTLSLTNDKNDKISVIFNQPITYRVSNESERLKVLGEHDILIGTWGFYFTKNSNFLNWIVEESCGLRELSELTHYMIISIYGDMIEVIDLTLTPPTVEVIE